MSVPYKQREWETRAVLADDKSVVVVRWSNIDGVFLDVRGPSVDLTIGPLGENAAEVLKTGIQDAIKDVFGS